MIGWLFGLGSAVLYGMSEFVGGLASRRSHFVVVALLGQCAGLIASALAGLMIGAESIPRSDLWWGALSGFGTAVGMAFLFRGLSRGAMSVIVPVSAVTGVSIPVLFGVVVEGQRPSLLAWLGIVVAVPALWLVAGRQSRNAEGLKGSGVGDGLVAGVGIAVQYLALAHASAASGLWPVAAGRVSAVLVLIVMAIFVMRHLKDEHDRSPLRTTMASGVLATSAGVLAAAALAAYAIATRHQLAAIAVVLSSMYPVIPVLLGVTVLREHLTRQQSAGLLAAAAATVLLAV